MLAALVKAQRLSEGFRDSLLTWHHSGFSMYGAQVVLPEERERIAHLVRGSLSDAIVADCDP